MLVIGIAIGCVVGFVLAVVGFRSLIVGTLKMAVDEYDGDSYLYVELNDRASWLLSSRKHVVMQVDNSRK